MYPNGVISPCGERLGSLESATKAAPETTCLDIPPRWAPDPGLEIFKTLGAVQRDLVKSRDARAHGPVRKIVNQAKNCPSGYPSGAEVPVICGGKWISSRANSAVLAVWDPRLVNAGEGCRRILLSVLLARPPRKDRDGKHLVLLISLRYGCGMVRGGTYIVADPRTS